MVIKSRVRNRDAYYLAALIAHDRLLSEPTPLLVSMTGSTMGQRFVINTEAFRVGCACDCDLIIEADPLMCRDCTRVSTAATTFCPSLINTPQMAHSLTTSLYRMHP